MDFWTIYPHFRNNQFEGRYIDPEQWSQYCLKLPKSFVQETQGSSFEGRPIHHLKWGQGSKKIFFWSQMHGNEPTATMALSDFFGLLIRGEREDHPGHSLVSSWKETFEFHFIPMLNPDGAAVYTRRNAEGIDLNRDAVVKRSPESGFFWSLIEKEKPHFGFNLHDQRSVFSAGFSESPATISLLAASPDKERNINPSRRVSIQLAGFLAQTLRHNLGTNIARYTDEFYPTAFGDNLQKMGVANVLIESGAAFNDVNRDIARQANFVCLAAGLEALRTESLNRVHEISYQSLPQNEMRFFDLVINNVQWKGSPSDVGLNAKELWNGSQLERVYEVADIGDLQFSPRFKSFDAKGLSWEGLLEIDKQPEAVFTDSDGSILTLDRLGGTVLSRTV